jgi:hypothetical protein
VSLAWAWLLLRNDSPMIRDVTNEIQTEEFDISTQKHADYWFKNYQDCVPITTQMSDFGGRIFAPSWEKTEC